MTAFNGNKRAQFFGMKRLPDIVPSASAASQVSYNEKLLGNIVRGKLEEAKNDELESIQSVGSKLSGTAQSVFKPKRDGIENPPEYEIELHPAFT